MSYASNIAPRSRYIRGIRRVHVPLHLPEDVAERVKAIARAQSISVNEFVYRLIEAEIRGDR